MFYTSNLSLAYIYKVIFIQKIAYFKPTSLQNLIFNKSFSSCSYTLVIKFLYVWIIIHIR